jgi:hypothetical protein
MQSMGVAAIASITRWPSFATSSSTARPANTQAQARRELFDFVEGYYNTGHRRSSLQPAWPRHAIAAKFELQWLEAREAERITK